MSDFFKSVTWYFYLPSINLMDVIVIGCVLPLLAEAWTMWIWVLLPVWIPYSVRKQREIHGE